MNWTALFGAITAGFKFLGGLFSKKQTASTEPVDAQAAREGTAAGAMANAASHLAGPRNAYEALGLDGIERDAEKKDKS